MHIAICDDDVAHRKHFERLMQRESNTRSVIDSPLYIDSYGSKEALFYSPMLYDLFFLAVKSQDLNSYDLAKELRDISVLKPIVIVKVDGHEYKEDSSFSDLYHIDDPLQPDQLHEMIQIGHSFSQSIKHLYEIHGVHETRYLPEEDILYADVRSNGKYTLHTVSGDEIECDMPLTDFFHMTENDLAFSYTGKNAIINVRYLEKVKMTKVLMTGGLSLPMSFGDATRMKLQKENFNDMLEENEQ